MRIAVLGAAGQLGRDLVTQLGKDVIPLTRDQINLDNLESIKAYISSLQADVLINCAAYNLVDIAETEKGSALAFHVNAIAVKHLAEACAVAKIKFVQISTDFVFGTDETRISPLTESAMPGPVSAYGVSKLAGEKFALAAHPRNLVIRTCGLYGLWGTGGKGGNFVETMLKKAGEGKPLKVVNDQRCTPSFTQDVSESIVELVRRDAQQIYHATNSDCCTWYELAREIFKLADIQPELTAITSEQFAAAARRPKYSVLSCDRLVSLGVSRPRPWREALAAYLKARKAK